MLYLILLLLLLLMLMPAMNYDDKQYAFHAKNTLDMRRGGDEERRSAADDAAVPRLRCKI